MKIYYNKKNDYLDALGRKIPCSNLVRNEVNGLRKPNQIVKSITKDGGVGVPYMPRDFPCGDWRVLSVTPTSDPYMAPFFIGTDAWQFCDEWEIKDSKYNRIIGRVPDYGYGLHFSNSPTTLGCIRIIDRNDLADLVEAIKLSWTAEESVEIHVSSMYSA